MGALFFACLLLIGILAAGKYPENTVYIKQILNSILGILTHVSLVLSEVFAVYPEKMVYGEQSKSYQQMAQLFIIAKTKLSDAIEANNTNEAEEIIWELAHEALIENGDWLLLHRSRPLEIPKG